MIGFEKTQTANSTYPKVGVSCSKDSFLVNQRLVFQIKFCVINPTTFSKLQKLYVILRQIKLFNKND